MAIFEAEVGQLTENQALTQEEWTNKTGRLESELNQATAQKVHMVASAIVFALLNPSMTDIVPCRSTRQSNNNVIVLSVLEAMK